MVELAAVVPISPGAAFAPPIDLDHLARMTLGDRSLEREVLALFDRQATMLMGRMQGALPAVVAACAHTIKGSARGIGAFGVADAAEAVELAAGESDKIAAALSRLGASIDEARSLIAERLRAH